MAYVDTETLKRNIRVNFMPNVDIDGTVTVENAERYFLNLIEKTSTVDVVKVVKCKDCVFLRNAITTTEHICTATTNPNYVSLDHFCSYGKRKE